MWALPFRNQKVGPDSLKKLMNTISKRFLKLASWDRYSYAGDPGAALGSPGTTKEAARAWAHGQPGHPGLAASSVVPVDPEAAHGPPAYEYGSQVANLKNLSVVGILAKIPMQIYPGLTPHIPCTHFI